MTVAVTDASATGCSIASGATDVDSDEMSIRNLITVITVNDAGDLDFEDDDNSFTLSILANNGNGVADVASVIPWSRRERYHSCIPSSGC